jgi:predicted nucleotidyltransferase
MMADQNKIDSHKKIEIFKTNCLSIFKDRLVCLILTGSYARNDCTPLSDIDLWLIINDLKQSDLKSVGEIVKSSDNLPEINPQCVSSSEINFRTFKEQFNPIQIYLDGIILYGSLPETSPSNEEIKIYSDSILASVMMSARHYISVNESEKSLAKGKLRKWLLNPLMWSLRYKVFIDTGKYPRTLDNLITSSLSNHEKQFAEIYSKLLSGTYKGSIIKVVEMVENYCKETLFM